MRKDFFSIPSRSTVAIILSLMVISVAAGCDTSPEQRMKQRLDNFLSILPDPIRENFENKKYNLAVELIEERLAADTEFAARWDEMKKAEAIGTFNTAEVINYFVVYFVNYRASGN